MVKQATLRDLNKLPTDGYVVFPLSMSRLGNAQSADECYRWLEFFEKKIEVFGLDAVFLYTNGLYFNSNENASAIRKKTNGQMISHSNAIRKLIVKSRKFMPQAIHYVPTDYVILNSPEFENYSLKLKRLLKEDKDFYNLLVQDSKDNKKDEASINFLIEEIVIAHLIRQKQIEFPKTLVKKDNFRLIAYPGPPLKSEVYVWKKKILPQSKDFRFYASHYDIEREVIYNFDEI